MCKRVRLAQPGARREATAQGALCLLAWPLPSCFSVGPYSQRAQGACMNTPACLYSMGASAIRRSARLVQFVLMCAPKCGVEGVTPGGCRDTPQALIQFHRTP